MTTHIIRVNSASEDNMRAARLLLAGISGPRDFGSLSSAWERFGFPAKLAIRDYREMYSRSAWARGVVTLLADGCWQGEAPRVVGAEGSRIEAEFARVMRHRWSRIKAWDVRGLVGAYSGLILRVADGKALSEPLGKGKLIGLIPAWEDQLKAKSRETDSNSPSFGEPTMFQFRSRGESAPANDAQGLAENWTDIHPSRVILWASGSDGGDFTDGRSFLEPVFNAILELENTVAGGANKIRLDTGRTIVYEIGEGVTARDLMPGVAPDDFQAEIKKRTEALNARPDGAVALGGMVPHTLQTAPVDLKEAFDSQIAQLSAGTGIPQAIIAGNQTGVLAGDQDRSAWLSRLMERRENECSEALAQVVRAMQAIGEVPAGDFEIKWPSLQTVSPDAKAKTLESIARAVQAWRAGMAGDAPELLTHEQALEFVGLEPDASTKKPTAPRINPAE